MTTKWVTQAGGGDSSGDSLANAYTLSEALSYVNGLGALSDTITMKLCGDFTLSGTSTITKDGASSYHIIWQGRNSGDTADETITMDCDGGSYSGWTIECDYHVFRQIKVSNNAGNNYGWIVGTGSSDTASYSVFLTCESQDCYGGWNGHVDSVHCKWVYCFADGDGGGGNGIYSADEDTSTCIGCEVTNFGGFFGMKVANAINCLVHYCASTLISANIAVNCSLGVSDGPGYLVSSPSTVIVESLVAQVSVSAFLQGSSTSLILLKAGNYDTDTRTLGDGVLSLDIDDPGLSANPFTASGFGDFSLNNTSGGGVECRNIDGVDFPGETTTQYRDLGGAQHIEAGGGIVGPPSKRGGKQ